MYLFLAVLGLRRYSGFSPVAASGATLRRGARASLLADNRLQAWVLPAAAPGALGLRRNGCGARD